MADVSAISPSLEPCCYEWDSIVHARATQLAQYYMKDKTISVDEYLKDALRVRLHQVSLGTIQCISGLYNESRCLPMHRASASILTGGSRWVEYEFDAHAEEMEGLVSLRCRINPVCIPGRPQPPRKKRSEADYLLQTFYFLRKHGSFEIQTDPWINMNWIQTHGRSKLSSLSTEMMHDLTLP
ncbi:unnamed protein product [Angiostrongylus costaricensis]|uniref:DDE_Tnp_1_7 domain-containing protein n=1 Tax=Angiostrongylus costaricensis TaxID=334426 RepID=A0A0R3PM44_ANGCS|nr:unnamed protein product [Angiostrongylus costaricensis]